MKCGYLRIWMVINFRQFFIGERLSLGRPSAESVVKSVSYDRQKPGTAVAMGSSSPILESPQGRFLDDVFSVLIVMTQPPRKIVGSIQMGQDRIFKIGRFVLIGLSFSPDHRVITFGNRLRLWPRILVMRVKSSDAGSHKPAVK